MEGVYVLFVNEIVLTSPTINKCVIRMAYALAVRVGSNVTEKISYL